jgi:hypothetical protein
VDKIFESLRDVTAERGSLLVLTYLPCADEYRAPRSSPWRVLARDVAARHGIPLIDLVSDLDNAPREEAETFFIGGLQDERLLSGAGHYTVGGNRFFARALYRRLEAIDAVRAKLSPLGSVDR